MREEFKVHILNEEGIQKAQEIAAIFELALNHLESTCGIDGRYMALVRTKMEEASFFAKKAMATREENQQV